MQWRTFVSSLAPYLYSCHCFFNFLKHYILIFTVLTLFCCPLCCCNNAHFPIVGLIEDHLILKETHSLTTTWIPLINEDSSQRKIIRFEYSSLYSTTISFSLLPWQWHLAQLFGSLTANHHPRHFNFSRSEFIWDVEDTVDKKMSSNKTTKEKRRIQNSSNRLHSGSPGLAVSLETTEALELHNLTCWKMTREFSLYSTSVSFRWCHWCCYIYQCVRSAREHLLFTPQIPLLDNYL